MAMFRTMAASWALGLALLVATGAGAEPVTFVVLGDMPYDEDQVERLQDIGKEIRKSDVPFVVHYGDVKGGGERCDTVILLQRRAMIYGLLAGAVFFTPGDNDWTDCDREKAGEFNELERLDTLRSIFFGPGIPLAEEWNIARQEPGYPENARWESGDLQFVTLHIVGTDNGRDKIKKSRKSAALAAVDARDAANLEWLDAAFDRAEARGAAGVVSIIHADPNDIEEESVKDIACSAVRPANCNPHWAFLDRLRRRANTFEKPVLLVHGSTKEYYLDKDFGGRELAGQVKAANLWRFNGPGDFAVIDGALVTFDSSDGDDPFKILGLLSEDAPPDC